MNRLGLLLIGAVLLIIPSSDVHAQSTRADSVTTFVETFLTGLMFGQGERAKVRLAELPALLPAGLEIPPGLAVAGSVEFNDISFTILRSTDPKAALSELGRSLEASGWMLRERESDTYFPAAGDMPEAFTYCRDGIMVGLSAMAEERHVSVIHVTSPFMSECRIREREGAREYPLIPMLASPEGARSLGSSGGGARDQWYWFTALVTSLSLDELQTHYAGELRKHGVELGGAVATETAVLTPIMLKRSNSEMWSGTAVISGDTESSQRHVQLFLARVIRE